MNVGARRRHQAVFYELGQATRVANCDESLTCGVGLASCLELYTPQGLLSMSRSKAVASQM